MHVELTIPTVPVAQPRARAAIKGEHAAVYTPKSHPVEAFKATVRMAFQEAYSGPPVDGPISVDAVFVFPRPKSKIWKTRPMPRYRHCKKPDRDNLDKAVLDALTGLAWRDDCQVCAGPVEKWVAAGDEQPHVRVVIRSLDDE